MATSTPHPGRNNTNAREKLLAGALQAFSKHGYHGATTREVATLAGMSPAALYIYFPTKSDLLEEISREGHEDVLAAVSAAALEPLEPVERLRRVVAVYVEWHARHNQLARVLNYELDALVAEAYTDVMRLRESIQRTLRDCVADALAEHHRTIDHFNLAVGTVVSIGIDTARWFRDDHDTDPAELGLIFADLVIGMFRLDDA